MALQGRMYSTNSLKIAGKNMALQGLIYIYSTHSLKIADINMALHGLIYTLKTD